VKFRLCLPPIVLCLVDQSVALLGQPSAYWHGHYETGIEFSPPCYWLLTHHPLAFEAGMALWMALFCGAILLSPRWLAMGISLALVIGHTWGATSWLLGHFGQGYWVCLPLFLAAGIMTSLCYGRGAA
jgi:hypothetical protein